jgi:hypothetical protein
VVALHAPSKTHLALLDQDQLTKITTIFCGEVEKSTNPQRLMSDPEEKQSTPGTTKKPLEKKNNTDSVQQRIIDSIDQGRDLISDDEVNLILSHR